MADEFTTSWQVLFARLARDDAQARQEFMGRAYERLRRLASHLFHHQFPDLVPRHDLDSVLNEAWLRLSQALASTTPATVHDFFGLAAHKIRQVLLDLVEKQRRRDARELAASGSQGPPEPPDRSHDPARLAVWSEFHSRAVDLPLDERQVFEMHYYLGMSQAEIADLLQLHPRKVSRLWVAATERLADVIPTLAAP